MPGIEDELLLDAESAARAVEFIKAHLPQELRGKFPDEALYYFLDVLVEYYAESDVLDQKPDAEGYIEIDMEAIARHLARKARAEGMGTFDPEDLLFVVQGEMDFQESEEEQV